MSSNLDRTSLVDDKGFNSWDKEHQNKWTSRVEQARNPGQARKRHVAARALARVVDDSAKSLVSCCPRAGVMMVLILIFTAYAFISSEQLCCWLFDLQWCSGKDLKCVISKHVLFEQYIKGIESRERMRRLWLNRGKEVSFDIRFKIQRCNKTSLSNTHIEPSTEFWQNSS